MYNIGIVGFGKMGQIRADVVEQCNSTVKYIYDLHTKSSKYNNVSDIHTILNDESIDIVFICTPNYLNKDYTIKALLANKHVFCEKPPSINAQELKEVIEVEKKTDKKLMYGFNHRHHDSIKKIQEIVAHKTYGDIVWMRGRYGKNVDNEYFKGWRTDKTKSGGGILIDQGIHMLDLFLSIENNFDKIHSFTSHKYWQIDGIEDNAFVILKNSISGVTAELHSTMAQWRHLFSLEIFLTNGYIVLNGLKTPSGKYGDEILTISNKNKIINDMEISTNITYNVDSSWKNEINYFFNKINNNESIDVGNSNDALKIMNIIDHIYNNQE